MRTLSRLIALVAGLQALVALADENSRPAPEVIGVVSSPSCSKFSRDGKFLAIGSAVSQDHQIAVVIYDLSKKKVVRSLAGFRDRIFAIEFLASDRDLVIFSWNGMVKRWSVVDGKEKTTSYGDKLSQAYCSCVSADGKLMMIGGREGAQVWDLTNQKELPSLDRFGGEPMSVAFSPDAKTLAVANKGRPAFSTWRVSDLSRTGFASGHDKGGFQLLYLPDGKSIVSIGEDGTLRAWNPEKLDEVKRIQLDSSIDQIACAASVPLIAAYGNSNIIRLYHGGDLRFVREITLPRTNSAPVHAELAPDGRRLAVVVGPNDYLLQYELGDSR